MRKLWYVYLGVLIILSKRVLKLAARLVGEFLKKFGRWLVSTGEDNTPRWNLELLRACYVERADAEFHMGVNVYRGPMFAALLSEKEIVFKMNWLAKRDAFGKDWKEHKGWGKLKLKQPGNPVRLPNGNVWFMFDDGYAVLFLGTPKERLVFDGPLETLRAYTYF